MRVLEAGICITSSGTDTRCRFRWAQIWLRVFFPENNQAIRLGSRAIELIAKLKDIKTLHAIPQDQNDKSSGEPGKMALQEAYKQLWEINSDGDQYKKLQFRLFHVLTGAFVELTPQSLLEAVRFDPADPDEYAELGPDQLKSMYSGFLHINSKGYLEYEHLSAKVFVQDIEDLVKTSRPMMADICIKALQRPSHQVWADAGICLIAWKKEAIKRLEGGYHDPRFDCEKPAWGMRGHFGTYVYLFWLTHCQVIQDDHQFVERMGKIFQAREPGIEAWIAVRAASRILHTLDYASVEGISIFCKSTLTRLAGELRPDAFLCMVSFGFSPFLQGTESERRLLPGFDDATLRELRNSEGKSALHIACSRDDIRMIRELLQWNPALLAVEDGQGRIPLHCAGSDEVVDALLDYERKFESSNKPCMAGLRESKLLHRKNRSGLTPLMDNILSCSYNFFGRILDEYRVGSLDLLLCHAVIRLEVEAVEQLVKRGANPHAKFGDCTAMRIAVRRELPRLVSYLEGQKIEKNDLSREILVRRMKDEILRVD